MRSREHIEKEPEFIVSLESRCLESASFRSNLQISVTVDTKGLDVIGWHVLDGIGPATVGARPRGLIVAPRAARCGPCFAGRLSRGTVRWRTPTCKSRRRAEELGVASPFNPSLLPSSSFQPFSSSARLLSLPFLHHHHRRRRPSPSWTSSPSSLSCHRPHHLQRPSWRLSSRQPSSFSPQRPSSSLPSSSLFLPLFSLSQAP